MSLESPRPLPPPQRTLPPPQPQQPAQADFATKLARFAETAFRPVVEKSTWTATAHLLADLPLGIAWFVVLVAGLSIALSLALSIVLLPFAVLVTLAVLAFARVIGRADRARAHRLLGLDAPAPTPPALTGGWWSRMLHRLGDPSSWRAVVYGLVLMFWGIIAFTVTVLAWMAPIGFGVGSWDSFSPSIGFGVIAAVVTLALAPRIVRGLAYVDKGLVRSLLAEERTAALERRVGELQVSRDATVDASAAELRRIERDLHDGAQQRLVALAMDLGLAKERLHAGAEPAQVAALVDRAHEEAKRAVVELRELVRGIHPAVLTDRGLDAALSALAARSPVPVSVDVTMTARPPAPVEATAYFVVAEALANIAKHSHASRAAVTVRRDADRLTIDVTDDGVGGAVVVPGGGLAGLADRVASAEGRWRLASPAGGPTHLAVELPCGS
jgi:signal transduction histidine kinase